MHLPEHGSPREEIRARLAAYKAHDKDWASGKIFGYIYDPGEEARAVNVEAYTQFLTESCLDPTTFPSVMQLEREVVRMVITLLQGGPEVVGSMTSGGTESIFLAVKTARDMMRAERGITAPEIVIPRTAHGAFHKACEYMGVKAVVADFDPATYRADVEAMRRCITPNTILLVGSAPSYAQGTVDPIPAIAALALEHNILCHVDACVGGIHLSIMRDLGMNPPPFDWSVPGVTSISADLHKFGYAAKNCSVVMYKNKAMRRHQMFACRRTTTYALVNPTLLSTKSGGPIAGAWAIMNFLGHEGYAKIVRATEDATRRLVDGINAIDGLRVLGRPDMCLFSFITEGINLFHLADAMAKRGWYLQPQFRTPQSPANLHLTVNHNSVARVDELLADLRTALDEVRALPNPIDPDLVRQQVEGLVANLSGDAFAALGAVAGIDGSGLPEEMALINTVLDSLPDNLAEGLLIDYVNDLFA
jgi:glutamate/tyrosine decarboxylase-like PLP-dependent enzyme